MPTIEAGLKSYIETTVTAAGKGYPYEVPLDAAYPAWAYQTISDNEVLSHGGRTGFAKARIQLDFIARETASKTDYAIIKEIADAARNALDGFKGSLGGVTVDYCKVEINDDWAEVHKLPVQRFDVIVNYHR